MHAPTLEALDEDPDDLSTWDVLADWLEERGDPRAEFMRLTRDVEFPNPALPAEQQARLRDALARAEAAWFPGAELREWGLVWRHGFVSRVLCAFGSEWRCDWFGSSTALKAHPALHFVREINVHRLETMESTKLPHLRVLRCAGLRPHALEHAELPQLELAVLMGKHAEWPARLPRPQRLITATTERLDPRVRYEAMRTWPGPVPLHTAWSFRESPPRQSARDVIKQCAACGHKNVQPLTHTTSNGHDNGGDFFTYHDEAWCPMCGAFTHHEHDV